MTPPKVLWLHSDRAGCGAYRAYFPALTLEEEGWFSNRMVLHNDADLRYDEHLKHVDLVVFQRTAHPIFQLWMKECRRRSIPIVYELDDQLFRIPRHNPAHREWDSRATQQCLRWQIKYADHVLCSTSPLRDAVIEHMGLPPHTISVAMNHMHRAVWGETAVRVQPPYDNQGRIVIGYQGSVTHNVDFGSALPALARIVAEHPQVMLRFFGYVPPIIQGVIPNNRFQWCCGVEFSQYPQKLAYLNFTIGLAPITDSKFNRCKSNLKFLEYSALGIPSVCSRVYPYASTVREGETGFLASTEEEWYTALTALVTDDALRTRIGTAAHAQVWQEWSADTRIAGWRHAFDRLLGRREDRQCAS